MMLILLSTVVSVDDVESAVELFFAVDFFLLNVRSMSTKFVLGESIQFFNMALHRWAFLASCLKSSSAAIVW